MLFDFVCCSVGTDPDGGKIRYSISGPVFSVDRDTGVVRLRQELDREKQDTVEVIISITGELNEKKFNERILNGCFHVNGSKILSKFCVMIYARLHTVIRTHVHSYRI